MSKQKINQEQSGIIYASEEKLTGDTWVDGKPVYRKVFNHGGLPNATSKSIAHGIGSISSVVSLRGYATNGTNFFPLPYVQITANLCVAIYVSGANIGIDTGVDRTAYNAGYIIIEYTKP